MHEIQPRFIGECSIRVGAAEVTPAAPHLFGLLLALTLEPSGVWSRRGLQELLFAGTPEEQSSHRLRQLLYRLRAGGVAITEQVDGFLAVANPVGDVYADAEKVPVGSGSGMDGHRTEILATYAPRLPAQFLDWLEGRRASLQQSLSTRRMEALRSARERQDWSTAARLATILQQNDLLSEELATVAAESYAMLGERDAALEAIDRFVRESDDELSVWPQLKKLRARILAARIPRREGTLRGRTECLAILAEQWERATSDTGGRACAVFGPPGMGKSRVGETFAAAIRLDGGQVLTHRCDAQNRQSPHALFTHLVRELRQLRGSAGADPALRSALDDLAPDSTVIARSATTVEARRDELRRAIIDLVEAVSVEQRLLIVVDDAHLLDDPSRAVIRSLADSTNGAAVLVLLLCRPRPDGFNLLSASKRFTAYTLTPLSDEDSRALVVEVAGRQALSASQLDWAVRHAGGNAFYLHALAHNPADDVSLPAHIRSLAQTSYLALSPDARTVLDACLLLDTLASPVRVTRAAALDERMLLQALRELEESDLLRYEDGLLIGPHAIIRDALLELIPTTSRAMLHRRIALLLSEECTSPSQARIVAWAAVSSWLAAGESASAVELALQVARGADAVGEPEAGAVLLSQLPRDAISLKRQREVLDAIIHLSDGGKCMSLRATAYKERTLLASRCAEDSNAIAELTIRSIAAAPARYDLQEIATLQRILRDTSITTVLRADAGARLLAIADLNFDETLASNTFSTLESELDRRHFDESRAIRAAIVFHTSFGTQSIACALSDELLRRHPTPTLEFQGRTSRSYAILSLLRIGYFERAADVARREWEFMSAHEHLMAGEHSGGMALDAHLALGDLESAKEIYLAIRRSSERRAMSDAAHEAAVYSPGVTLALYDGDFAEAERLLCEAETILDIGSVPRLRSVTVQLRLKAALLQADNAAIPPLLTELRSLFLKGRMRGGQDAIAEALWLALVAEGDTHGASTLLSDYLCIRREVGDAEWSLKATTARDSAWIAWTDHDSNTPSTTE